MEENKVDWAAVKEVAASGSDKKLEHYVLEIQRLAVDLPLIRKFEPKDSKGRSSPHQTGVKGAKPGDILILRVVSPFSSSHPTKSPNHLYRNKLPGAVPSLLHTRTKPTSAPTPRITSSTATPPEKSLIRNV